MGIFRFSVRAHLFLSNQRTRRVSLSTSFVFLPTDKTEKQSDFHVIYHLRVY